MNPKVVSFNIPITPTVDIDVPQGSRFLAVQPSAIFVNGAYEGEGIKGWYAIPDSRAPKARVTFKLFATGQEMIGDKELQYRGTVQLDQGKKTIHVFEEIGSGIMIANRIP